MTKQADVGKIGEELAARFLVRLDFIILERNYRIRYGELDIIAKKGDILHFVEVKTVQVTSLEKINELSVQPEENVTFKKWGNLLLTTETYRKRAMVTGSSYQIDLACVYLDMKRHIGRVKLLQNINKE